ncbi:hypothetical protein CKAH01_07357 [Colletotrichum kahawae]|uniref:Uncharacterized protein n=1 Tax=Colletotrichum kahawae TaxID=34407 RepID=A0AAD9Y7I1_COLKA|nr:hypothetical protein CKAH01_07357 [Colletotrichum kahawae]
MGVAVTVPLCEFHQLNLGAAITNGAANLKGSGLEWRPDGKHDQIDDARDWCLPAGIVVRGKGCSAGHNVKATSFEERTLFSGDKQGAAVKLPAEAHRRLATAAGGSQCAADDKRSTDKLDDREAVLWPARPVGA